MFNPDKFNHREETASDAGWPGGSDEKDYFAGNPNAPRRSLYMEAYKGQQERRGQKALTSTEDILGRQTNEILAQDGTGNTEESASNAGSAVDLRGTKPYAEPYQPDNETTDENIA